MFSEAGCQKCFSGLVECDVNSLSFQSQVCTALVGWNQTENPRQLLKLYVFSLKWRFEESAGTLNQTKLCHRVEAHLEKQTTWTDELSTHGLMGLVRAHAHKTLAPRSIFPHTHTHTHGHRLIVWQIYTHLPFSGLHLCSSQPRENNSRQENNSL